MSNLEQYDFIEIVIYVMFDEIKNVMKYAKFISVMLYEAVTLPIILIITCFFIHWITRTNLLQKYKFQSKIIA